MRRGYRTLNVVRNEGRFIWEVMRKASRLSKVCVVRDLDFRKIQPKGNSEGEDFLEAGHDCLNIS